MQNVLIWIVHTPAGAVALIAAFFAIAFKKGAYHHRKAGVYFTIAMSIMLMSGSIAAILKNSADDVFLSAIVFYSVFTAWLTAYRKERETGILEYIALVWIVSLGTLAYLVDPQWDAVRDPNTYVLWTIFSAIFACGDINNILRRGLSGRARMLRHIWRVGFSLIWAAIALGDKIIKMLDSTIEAMPYLIITPALTILSIILYWTFIVLFSPNPKSVPLNQKT